MAFFDEIAAPSETGFKKKKKKSLDSLLQNAVLLPVRNPSNAPCSYINGSLQLVNYTYWILQMKMSPNGKSSENSQLASFTPNLASWFVLPVLIYSDQLTDNLYSLTNFPSEPSGLEMSTLLVTAVYTICFPVTLLKTQQCLHAESLNKCNYIALPLVFYVIDILQHSVKFRQFIHWVSFPEYKQHASLIIIPTELQGSSHQPGDQIHTTYCACDNPDIHSLPQCQCISNFLIQTGHDHACFVWQMLSQHGDSHTIKTVASCNDFS